MKSIFSSVPSGAVWLYSLNESKFRSGATTSYPLDRVEYMEL